MPPRSQGCQTCKARRIKCDEGRPICMKCRSSKRRCAYEAEQNSYSFVSENAFARGRPRRPKETRKQSYAFEKALLSNDANLVHASIVLPLEVHAFEFFAWHFVAAQHNDPEIAHDHWFHVWDAWRESGPNSVLRLTISAMSGIVYGRLGNNPKAIEMSRRKYAQALSRTRNAVHDINSVNAEHFVLAIMLMGNYENSTYAIDSSASSSPNTTSDITESPTGARDSDFSARFPQVFFHHDAVMSIFDVQRQRHPQDRVRPASRHVRRQLLRTCILRGLSFPRWLEDGSCYGEIGIGLKLDDCMVRTARLRNKVLTTLNRDCDTMTSIPDLLSLVVETQLIDEDLSNWATSLSDDWLFTIHKYTSQGNRRHVGSSFRPECLQRYTSPGHAAVYNRYRATRLIVNSICMRLLSYLKDCPSIESTLQQQRCLLTIQSLADEIAASLPFALGWVRGIDSADKLILKKTNASGVRASSSVFIAWPLVVATGIAETPSEQRHFFRLVLRTLGEAIPDDVLISVASSSMMFSWAE